MKYVQKSVVLPYEKYRRLIENRSNNTESKTASNEEHILSSTINGAKVETPMDVKENYKGIDDRYSASSVMKRKASVPVNRQLPKDITSKRRHSKSPKHKSTETKDGRVSKVIVRPSTAERRSKKSLRPPGTPGTKRREKQKWITLYK